MFDPSVGRWFEEDPQGFATGDPNLFRDVTNNPTNATDPSGLAEVAPEPRLGVPKADWGVAPAQGYAKASWMVGENDGNGWWLMIPQVSIAPLNDGKVSYAFNIVVRPPKIKDKQSVFLNKIYELGILDTNTPMIGPIITSDKTGTKPTGATGDTIYSVDVGGDLGADGKEAKYKLDVIQRSGIREQIMTVQPTKGKNDFPVLRRFAPGNAPSANLFCEPDTDITGRKFDKTVTAGNSENADWIVWVQRTTKTFGFVDEIKVSKTGQYFISKNAYERYLAEIKTNLNAKVDPAPAVTMQWTYIFVNPTTTAKIPAATLDEFLKRLESEFEVPASAITEIKRLLALKLPKKGPLKEILLDNPRDPKHPLQVQP
jgi:hypothetical protein